MRKYFILGAALVVSVAMLFTSCKKEEVNNNGNNSGNTENPGGGSDGSGSGGGSGSGNQEYPETAVVLPNAVSDIDGNSYDAVQIGNQVWMAENLRTTRYADGTSIPFGTSASTTTAYRYAPGPNQSNEENMVNVASYGYLYNWPAVMHGVSSSESNPSGVQGICPTGWHVPIDAEWTHLTVYVGSQSQYQCNGSSTNIAKALASTTGWNEYNTECAVGNNPSTNNATGFSALPAGKYGHGYDYNCYRFFGTDAIFWSATKYNDYGAYNRFLEYSYATVFVGSGDKDLGYSVRCVRD